jgi:uncharacterized Tic20 family protein
MSEATQVRVTPASKEERLYAAACHFAGLPVFAVVALANLLAPLVIWLMKKDAMPFVDEHGKESLNFQITMLIAYGVAGVLACVWVGFVLLSVIAVLHLIFPIIAGISAYDGKNYRYPLTIRLIS